MKKEPTALANIGTNESDFMGDNLAEIIHKLETLESNIEDYQAKIKDLESTNGELREWIKELEELIPTKEEAIKAKDYLIRTHKPSTYGIHSILNKCTLCNFIAKLQKIIDKRG